MYPLYTEHPGRGAIQSWKKMQKNEIKIHTFNELHNVIENYDPRTVIYQGVKSVTDPLVPKIGRIVPPKSAKSREWNEKDARRGMSKLPGLQGE